MSLSSSLSTTRYFRCHLSLPNVIFISLPNVILFLSTKRKLRYRLSARHHLDRLAVYQTSFFRHRLSLPNVTFVIVYLYQTVSSSSPFSLPNVTFVVNCLCQTLSSLSSLSAKHHVDNRLALYQTLSSLSTKRDLRYRLSLPYGVFIIYQTSFSSSLSFLPSSLSTKSYLRRLSLCQNLFTSSFTLRNIVCVVSLLTYSFLV